MSASRKSFPGIAQAWIARGNGVPKAVVLVVHQLELICEITQIADIEVSHILSLGCALETENIDTFHFLSLVCEVTSTGDIQPVNSLSLVCETTSTGDIQPVHSLNILVTIMVSGP